MKHLLLLIGIFCLISTTSFSQNKKAEKEAAAKVQFEKASAAIDAKDFVIIVDTYEAANKTLQTNTDVTNFISYEKGFVFLQGILFTPANTLYKMDVSEYKQELDKKGNIRIMMQLSGSIMKAKAEIFLRKGGNYADIILTPTKGETKRFSGDVVPRTESRYFKRPGEV